MGQRVAVSGGSFDNLDGHISIFEVVDGVLKFEEEYCIEHPLAHESQCGKGITGLVYDRICNSFWACFSNCIVKYELNSKEIVEVIFDNRFNDLHDLFMHGGNLVTVNTGNESIDTINVQTKEITRIDFLGSDLRKRTPNVTNYSSTKPHLHHISSARYNQSNELIVGFFKQQRVINIDNWSQIGIRMDSPVHDIQIIDGEVFWTTVSGKVYSSKSHKPILDLKKHCDSIGWTRGLFISPDYFLIGLTSIRETNSNFFNILTGENVVSNSAKIIVYNRIKEQISMELVLNRPKSTKIYSIISI